MVPIWGKFLDILLSSSTHHKTRKVITWRNKTRKRGKKQRSTRTRSHSFYSTLYIPVSVRTVHSYFKPTSRMVHRLSTFTRESKTLEDTQETSEETPGNRDVTKNYNLWARDLLENVLRNESGTCVEKRIKDASYHLTVWKNDHNRTRPSVGRSYLRKVLSSSTLLGNRVSFWAAGTVWFETFLFGECDDRKEENSETRCVPNRNVYWSFGTLVK